MVVYVSEELYQELQEIAQADNRSISSVTERKIAEALKDQGQNDEPCRSGSDRSVLMPEMIKPSVLEVINNLPDENLAILAERLSSLLNRHVPDQTEPMESTMVQKPDTIVAKVENSSVKSGKKTFSDRGKDSDIKQARMVEVCSKLYNFLNEHKYTQRSFKQKYGIDISSIGAWKRGKKGMSNDLIIRLEKIIASGS